MKKFFRILTVFLATLFVFTAASCGKKISAQEWINLINLPQDRTSVAEDFKVNSVLTQGEESVTVTWASKNEAALTFEEKAGDKDAHVITAVVHQSETEVQTAEFTATVNVGSDSASKDFKVRVARALTPEEVLSAFYNGGFKKDDAVSLKGYIGWLGEYSEEYKNATAFIIDATQKGGFYAFRLGFKDKAEYDQFSVGQAVTVSGKYSEFGGSAQVDKGGKLTAREAEAITITPNDITEAMINANLAGDVQKGLKMSTSAYVTVKNLKVTKIATELNDGDHTTVLLAERAGVTVALQISKYMYQDTKGATPTAILTKAKTLKVGDYVDLTGFASFYEGQLQLVSNSADQIVKSAAPTNPSDNEKLLSAMGVAEAQFAKTFLVPKEYELKATVDGVKVAYEITSEANEAFSITDNILTVNVCTAKQEGEVKITVTLGEGDAAKKLERTVAISVFAKELNAWEKYYYADNEAELADITAVVRFAHITADKPKKTEGKDEWKASVKMSAWIQNDLGGYYVEYYKSIKGATEAEAQTAVDAEKAAVAEKFAVGYEVTISGAKKSDSHGAQGVKNIDLAKVTKGEKKDLAAAKDINSIVGTEAVDLLQGSYVTVSGTLTEVKNGNFTNYFVVDGDKKIEIRFEFKKTGMSMQNADKTDSEIGKAVKAFLGKKVTGYGVVTFGFGANYLIAVEADAIGEYVAPVEPVEPEFTETHKIAGLVSEKTLLDDSKNNAEVLGLDATKWVITSGEGKGVLVDGTPKYTNPIALYGESLRIYHSGSDASRHGFVTFKNTEHKISAIAFSHDNNKKKDVKVNINGVEYTCAEVKGRLVVVFDEAVDEVKVEALNNQFRITEFEVAFAA